ncbi:MAG TPA: potassium-transporting ATPase subunit KdpA [Gemmatimonadota bacterium]|jgi:K+-transporting ATPase ATPase A chain
MTSNGYLQLAFYVVVLIALAKPLGAYMARVYEGRPFGLDRVLGPVERLIYRLGGVRAGEEMGWKTYAAAMLLFNVVGLLAVYALQRAQAFLPLNPAGMANVAPHSAWNVAVSFATNTNWQNYGGEATLGYLVQMLGLTVQNFVSAAAGMAVAAALIRALARREGNTIGNFWVDLTRSTLYILLPLAIVLAGIQTSQGVIQNLDAYKTAELVEATADAEGKPVTEQVLPMGPASSQIAIKQLGTNGGGFFNVNSAHPYENATPLSNFFELLAILLISAALCYTYGVMVGDTRQGWAVLAAMTVVFVALLAVAVWSEQSGNPRLTPLGVDQTASALQAGGNMEGKEARFGIATSALWATATTSASNGSVNSMHDSFTPLGGFVPMWLMQLGEVIYGGVGSGLYGMLMFLIVAVFVAGLMVGRTPEWLGKKIEPFEMKMASIAVLVPPAVSLIPTAIAVLAPTALATLWNHEAHGLSEILYAFSSMGNNNGSAFAGYGANIPLVNVMGGLGMLFSRYWTAIPVLAVAGSLVEKKRTPSGAGTLPTHTPLFVVMLVSTVIIVGALTFIPALALGPFVEHLQMLK